jgi:DNA repair protein RadB
LERIATDCKAIDESLMGGLSVGSLTLVYGEAETGKTTLAIQCAANCAKRGFKTMFVDSESTFSSRRLSQIAADDFDVVSERIILVRPKDFHEQGAVVDQLTDYLNKSFKLVVFDTITSLYSLQIAETPSKTFALNRELNRQLAVLAQTAKVQKIAVLLTSQVHAVFNEVSSGVEPVGTRVLKFWSDTVLALKPAEDIKAIRATLEKANSTSSVITFDLRIEQKGMRDCSVH